MATEAQLKTYGNWSLQRLCMEEPFEHSNRSTLKLTEDTGTKDQSDALHRYQKRQFLLSPLLVSSETKQVNEELS